MKNEWTLGLLDNIGTAIFDSVVFISDLQFSKVLG